VTETKFIVRNNEEIQKFLKSLPRGSLRVGLRAFSEYVLGNSQRGLKHNEPYKYVTRKRAYGVTFFSAKQRAYVMAKIRSGEIKPGTNQRTGKTAAAWELRETNNGYGMSIVNPRAGAYYTRDDYGQARQPKLVGWRKVTKVITDNMRGAMRSTLAAVNKWIKENKP
jgi:hypothetical protein